MDNTVTTGYAPHEWVPVTLRDDDLEQEGWRNYCQHKGCLWNGSTHFYASFADAAAGRLTDMAEHNQLLQQQLHGSPVPAEAGPDTAHPSAADAGQPDTDAGKPAGDTPSAGDVAYGGERRGSAEPERRSGSFASGAAVKQQAMSHLNPETGVRSGTPEQTGSAADAAKGGQDSPEEQKKQKQAAAPDSGPAGLTG